ncbi:MAG: low molecular weight protein-tyrosine-phosphatase [Erysipelotrichia bacterium]|nr:low molecular weight protein-tyrosine-phosphatase [Erysipelotrichia bacterium]
MIKILFVCHGNICRSVMAQFMLEDLLKKEGLEKDFVVDSAATTSEEIGNDMYYAAKDILTKHGIPYGHHCARKISAKDIDDFDEIICMDQENLLSLYRQFGRLPKIKKLLGNQDVDDPWWTRDFEKTYVDIDEGLHNIVRDINKYTKIK